LEKRVGRKGGMGNGMRGGWEHKEPYIYI